MTYILQLKDLKVDQWIESCIRVNTRELNRELCTELSTLYTTTHSLYYSIFEPTLNSHVFALRSTYIIYVVWCHSSNVICDHVTVTVWLWYYINPIPKSPQIKIKRKENEKWKMKEEK